MSRNKLIVIYGPTASGKTDLGIYLAKKFNGEIIAADSRTIYKGMDIGTAKPLGKKIKNRFVVDDIPHYLIDIVKPDQEFNVSHFKKRAIKIIKNIQKRGKVPFLVGGTALWIQAVIDNLKLPKVPPDIKLRKKLENQYKKYGLDYLWKKLLKLDPQAKNFVQKENPRRIIRALEVCLKTKKPFSSQRKKGKPLFDVLILAIKMPRKKLYQRINQRLIKMIDQGLIEEVKNLIKKYPQNLPPFQGHIYKQIIEYLNGKLSLEQAIRIANRDTRKYAKRQLTWFKKDPRIKWIKTRKEAENLVKKFLKTN